MAKIARGTLGLVFSVVLMVAGAGIAGASPAGAPGRDVCRGGSIDSGTYHNLLVAGPCTVPDGATVTVVGTLTLAPGSAFDAQTLGEVHVTGNVLALRGSNFALGCTVGGVGCEADTHDVVDGNVVGVGALTLRINGSTIHGSIISVGGGNTSDNVNFPLKDNVIDGNVTVIGWSGTWFGLIRSQVGGNATIIRNRSNFSNPVQGPDSNEVIANDIGGNLVCFGNDPVAQYGDGLADAPPGYGPNTVGGRALGECAALTSLPAVQ